MLAYSMGRCRIVRHVDWIVVDILLLRLTAADGAAASVKEADERRPHFRIVVAVDTALRASKVVCWASILLAV